MLNAYASVTLIWLDDDLECAVMVLNGMDMVVHGLSFIRAAEEPIGGYVEQVSKHDELL